MKLARLGARQTRYELDRTRILVRRDGALYEFLQLAHHVFVRFVTGLQHDERLDDLPSFLVGRADNAALRHRAMKQQLDPAFILNRDVVFDRPEAG